MTYLIFNEQLRIESDAQVIENLLRKGAKEIASPPSPDAEWVNNQWVIPPPPTYTAGEWLEHIGFGSSQQPTLIYLKMQLGMYGRRSDKLNATEQFLNSVLTTFAHDPSPRSDWEQPPYQFQEVVAEAMEVLAS